MTALNETDVTDGDDDGEWLMLIQYKETLSLSIVSYDAHSMR